MELKPGYKQTEVGVIPEDWEIKKLGELARFRTGPFGSTLHKEDYTNNGIPIVNPMHIVDGNIVATQEMTITAQRASELAEFRLWEGDIVIGRRGEMGRCAVVKAVQNGWLCGTGSMIIRTNPLASADFLQLVLSSPPIVAAIENASVGSTMINLNQSVLAGLKVALPGSKEEQETISSSINAAGAQVEVLQALITKKQQIKQATMQELLTGKRRLPGFEGEWVVKRLGDIAEITMGQSPSSTNYNTHGRGMPLIQGNADIKNRETVERVFTTQITKRGFKGDILMSVRAPVGEVSRATIDVCLGRGVCAIRFPNNFLYHYLIFLEPTWVKHSKGSTFDSINTADLKAIDIHLPYESLEQIAIAECLAQMDAELATLEMRLTKAHALKQGMMQQLLTGKIRLR
jgi:type I restriction enzyme S subunit